MRDEITNSVRAKIDVFHHGFEQHAAVEAIDAAIKDADGAQRRLGLHIGWLQDVKRQRKAKVSQGHSGVNATDL